MERDDFESFIRANRAEFNKGELPDGHFERFQQRLQASMERTASQEQKECGESNSHSPMAVRRALRWGRFAAISSAAAVVILLTCGIVLRSIGGDPNEGIRTLATEHYTAIEQISREIMDEFGGSEIREYEISASLESILQEGIPLENLLPEELDREQRMKILKEYYKERVNALLQFKSLLTQENMNIYE